jgi:DNA-directed RNA polymerase subunit M/transcription elongation factor TFIIS
MPNGDPQLPTPSHQVKTACVAHKCPSCGTDHHVSVEHVLTGDKTVTWCHCRACGHSWHPVTVES